MSTPTPTIAIHTHSGSEYRLIPTQSLGTVLVKVTSGPDRFSQTMEGVAWDVTFQPIIVGNPAVITGTCARTGRDGYTVDTSRVVSVVVRPNSADSVLIPVR